MTTPVDFLAGIIIALAVAFLVAIVPVFLYIRKLHKTLQGSRNYAARLEKYRSEAFAELSKAKYDLALARWKHSNSDGELSKAVVYIADLLGELDTIKQRPLALLSDDRLVAIVRGELERRVVARSEYRGVVITEGNHKIASKVGGAAFRVVDKAKRGKLGI